MPSNDKDSISNLVSVFSALNKIKDEPRGVSSHTSVIKDNEDRVDPNLKSTEVERLKKIATVFGQTLKIGEYAPKQESQRLQDLTPEKQKSLGVSAISDKVKSVQLEKKQGEKGDWLSNLLNLLGGGALAGLGWSMLPKELKDKIKGKITEWATGLGNIIAENLPGMLSTVGSFISEQLGQLWNGTGPAGKVRFIQLIAKPITAILDGMFDVVGSMVKGYRKVFPNQPISREGRLPPKTNIIPAAEEAIERSIGKTPSLLSRGVSNIKGYAGRGLESIGKGLKSANSVALEMLRPAERYLGGLFKTTKGTYKLAKNILKMPFLAEIIEAGLFTKYKVEQDELYDNNKITLDEYKRNIGSRAINSMGGIVGGMGGMAFATALNAAGAFASGGILAPVAFAIQPALAVGGAFVGDYLGRMFANALSNASPEFAMAIGASVPYSRGGDIQNKELQDFFVRDKKVFSFSNKDEVLGIKTGGAIDNFLKSQNDSGMVENVISHNKFTKTALIEQIKRQDTMIELLTALTRKTFGNVINQQPQQSSHSFGENFRDAYNSQTLAIN
jgi:hypothetical protein